VAVVLLSSRGACHCAVRDVERTTETTSVVRTLLWSHGAAA